MKIPTKAKILYGKVDECLHPTIKLELEVLECIKLY